MYSSRLLFQSFDKLIKNRDLGFFPGVEKKENDRERKITYSTAKCAADCNSGSDSSQTTCFSSHLWNTCFSGRFWDSNLLLMCVFFLSGNNFEVALSPLFKFFFFFTWRIIMDFVFRDKANKSYRDFLQNQS